MTIDIRCNLEGSDFTAVSVGLMCGVDWDGVRTNPQTSGGVKFWESARFVVPTETDHHDYLRDFE